MMGSNVLLLLLSIIIGTFCFCYNRLGIQVGPQEPTFVPARFPYIGHAIGLLRSGSSYWVKVNARHKLPIFTVGLLKKKFYIVTSLELLNSVHRNSKTLSFSPFVTMTAEKLSSLRPEQVEMFKKRDGKAGLAEETIAGVEASLKQADVDNLNLTMLESLKTIIDDIPVGHSCHCKLHAWVRHTITQGSTRAIYGPKNPFKDQSIENSFWAFEENASVLLNGFLPQVTGRKGLAARDVVAKAFLQYYMNGDQQRASALAHTKWLVPASYGLGEEEISRIEVPFLIGVLNNTAPTTFWAICHIFSEPGVLSALRSELAGAVDICSSASGSRRHVIDLGLIKRKCPVLLSVLHEVLRKRTSFSASRFVTADTCITDGTRSYLLKAGSILQIPADIIHTDTEYWGSEAKVTDYLRFVNPSKKKQHPLAFRSFGGAPYICPGRQFATTEIMAIVAMLTMRYEISPVRGSWQFPKQKLSMFGSVPPPAEDIEVVFQQREGWEGDWEFRRGETGLTWALESG